MRRFARGLQGNESQGRTAAAGPIAPAAGVLGQRQGRQSCRARILSRTVSGGGEGADPTGYLVDSLFRKQQPEASGNTQEVRGEASRIVLSGLRSGDVPAADKTYLAQLVAARTGVSQEDAQKRVDEVIAKAKDAEAKARQAADAARKAATYLSLFTAFSMLIGAFVAGVAAAFGGHQRDEFAERVGGIGRRGV